MDLTELPIINNTDCSHFKNNRLRAWNFDFRKRGIKFYSTTISFAAFEKCSNLIRSKTEKKKNICFYSWKLANFFFFLFLFPLEIGQFLFFYFLLLLEISQSYWKNVQTYSKTKFQHLIRTCSYKPPVYNTTSNFNRYHNPTQFFLLLKKKKKKSKGQDEQLSMETGWSKVLHGTCRFQR